MSDSECEMVCVVATVVCIAVMSVANAIFSRDQPPTPTP